MLIPSIPKSNTYMLKPIMNYIFLDLNITMPPRNTFLGSLESPSVFRFKYNNANKKHIFEIFRKPFSTGVIIQTLLLFTD